MFRIGEFSKIAQVSGHLLRHYDEIGLLNPAHIDEWTGYRYYSATQLPRLNRILALKDLGLSLEQAQKILAENISGDTIREMLLQRKVQIEHTVQAEVVRLRHVEARLAQIDSEGSLQDLEIIVKSIPEQSFLSTPYILPSFEETPALAEHITQVVTPIVGQRRLGHLAAVFDHEMFTTENIEMDVGFLLAEPINLDVPFTPVQNFSLRTLPSVEQMVTIVENEVHQILYRSHAALGAWIEQNGYEIAGPARKIHLAPHSKDEDHSTLVEIQFPIRPLNKLSQVFR